MRVPFYKGTLFFAHTTFEIPFSTPSTIHPSLLKHTCRIDKVTPKPSHLIHTPQTNPSKRLSIHSRLTFHVSRLQHSFPSLRPDVLLLSRYGKESKSPFCSKPHRWFAYRWCTHCTVQLFICQTAWWRFRFAHRRHRPNPLCAGSGRVYLPNPRVVWPASRREPEARRQLCPLSPERKERNV